jgi:hypothetical protein
MRENNFFKTPRLPAELSKRGVLPIRTDNNENSGKALNNHIKDIVCATREAYNLNVMNTYKKCNLTGMINRLYTLLKYFYRNDRRFIFIRQFMFPGLI